MLYYTWANEWTTGLRARDLNMENVDKENKKLLLFQVNLGNRLDFVWTEEDARNAKGNA